MSEPEIARRCAACGVSVRQHALFCPQCGNPIAQADDDNRLFSCRHDHRDRADPGTHPVAAYCNHKVSEDGVRGRKVQRVSSV